MKTPVQQASPPGLQNPPAGPLPWVVVNMSMTADGKIAPAGRAFVPFGSPRDQAHLLELRAQADAVMAGARTVDGAVVTLGPGPARYRRLRRRRGLAEYNLRVIVSGSGSVNPRAAIFQHRFSPLIVLTTARAGRRRLAQLRRRADAVRIGGASEIDFHDALCWLREEWDVRHLLCEGGGELNDALFRAGLVNELHLTLCPWLLGGRAAPTLADGVGVERLADACQLSLRSTRRVGDDLFLVYRAAGPLANPPSYSSRSAVATGRRAARRAGKRPPTSPITVA